VKPQVNGGREGSLTEEPDLEPSIEAERRPSGGEALVEGRRPSVRDPMQVEGRRLSSVMVDVEERTAEEASQSQRRGSRVMLL